MSMGKLTGVVETAKEEDESEAEEEPQVQKRNPDTDCKNLAFERSIRARSMASRSNFMIKNVATMRGMSTGRPPKARIEVPENI